MTKLRRTNYFLTVSCFKKNDDDDDDDDDDGDDDDDDDERWGD